MTNPNFFLAKVEDFIDPETEKGVILK